jgi:hypothetical protein
MSNGLFDFGRNLLDTAGQYYLGKEGQEGATAAGQAALATGEQIGQTGAGLAEFKPYTVTSGLATGTTTPEGGLDLQLSPEEQARQAQYLAQSQGLFGGVGQDVAAGSQALYEQIRAAQRPEEERERLRMQEGLLSKGRQGIRTAAYGGTPEQLAFEQARQEAMLNAQIAARTQFGTEQDRMLQQAEGLMTAGYNPQRQAIDLFGAAATPADIAGAGRRQGASVYGQSAIKGLEGMMQGEKLANELRQQQIQAMLGGVTGSRDPLTGELGGGLFDLGVDVIGDFWDKYGIGGSAYGTSTIGGTQMTSGGNRGASQAGAYTGGGTGMSRGGDADGDGVMNIHDKYPQDPTRS